MEITKKILYVILIFVVIQIASMIFSVNKSYAEDGFFNKAFSSGAQWKQMGGSNSQGLIENANGVFKATEEIYDTVRGIGVALFLVNIVITIIALSMSNNGKDIAGMKLTIGFTFLLAVLFIFAKQIMGFFEGIFTDLEGLM